MNEQIIRDIFNNSRTLEFVNKRIIITDQIGIKMSFHMDDERIKKLREMLKNERSKKEKKVKDKHSQKKT